MVGVQRQDDTSACVSANQSKLLLSRFLSKFVAVGDEITFPIPEPDAPGAEILITKNATSGPIRHIYQAPIGYGPKHARTFYLTTLQGIMGVKRAAQAKVFEALREIPAAGIQ